jgi:tetratricopeptide (TPR) repeat protein/NAD-dependent dihydropyrimidine dehydrogenase PreA subunit
VPNLTSASTRCTGADLAQRGAVSLPVLAVEHGPRGTVRRSRSGRRRAAVLAAVQLLMIAHVVLWLLSREYGWWGGRTTTPIEPSESMELVKHGVINAGAIFFALALLATLVLGRWFCGWGCHLVMLQDLCGWIMRRMGVRPRPFRSRLLVYVPLVLALYMFAWPPFYRLAIAPWTRPDLQWPGFSVHLTTAEFWKTFPGVMVAVPFLLICGFACVYFLGSKGFCTYGCPYGGFFAPLDRLAVGRIRVTDACEGCGHCTAVCTSNVRVHEEVREFGMVVDPGCMKCLDCVSVCPKEALYFGFGRPEVLRGPARRAEPKRSYDLSWPQEIALTAIFVAAFASLRGVYNLVPMLMAGGAAGVVTFMAWTLWRMVREPNVTLHRFQLRYGGKVGRAGAVFAGFAVAVLAITAHCGVVNALESAAQYQEHVAKDRLDMLGMEHAAGALDRAISLYTLASAIGEGGIGLTGNAGCDLALARLHQARGDDAQAEAMLRRAIGRNPSNESLHLQLLALQRRQHKNAEAILVARQALDENPRFARLRDEMIRALADSGRTDEAIETARRGLALEPGNLLLLRRLALLAHESGDMQEAIDLTRRSVELDTLNPRAHAALAFLLAEAGDADGAAVAAARAIELAPRDDALRGDMNRIIEAAKDERKE